MDTLSLAKYETDECLKSFKRWLGWVKTVDEADEEIKFFPTDLVYLQYLADELQYSKDKITWVPKSRRLMWTWLKIAHMVWKAMNSPAYHGFIQSNKEKDANHLIEKRAFLIWENLPDWMKWVAMQGKVRANYKWLELNLPNGAMIWGVPQGPDVLRQYTPSDIFVDEAAKQVEFEKAVTAMLPFTEKKTQLFFVSSARSEYRKNFFGQVVTSTKASPIEEPMRGIQKWYLEHGGKVLRTHYTCDPAKDPERDGALWLAEQDKTWEGGLEGAKWQQEMEIDFGAYSGKRMFPSFDRNKHVIEPFEIPADAPRWRAIDWGFRNPTAVLWITELQGTYFVYREYYQTGLNTDAFKYQKHEIGAGETYITTDIDPASDRQEAADMDTVFKLLNMEPYKLNAWKANRSSGGNELIRKWFDEDDRIKIFSDCYHCIEEVEEYRFDDWGEEAQTRHSPKETPRKINDHTPNALKYFANRVLQREQKRTRAAAPRKDQHGTFGWLIKKMKREKNKGTYKMGDPDFVRKLA